MVKTIEFRFTPFSVALRDSDVMRSVSESEVDLLPWCSLPDILYSEIGRQFVGLSFPIDIGSERSAAKFANSQETELLQCILPHQVAQLPRYVGFGGSGRLEMLWDRATDGGLRCEFASLFNGVWFLSSVSAEHVHADYEPRGYVLADLQSLLTDYGLTLP